MEYLNSSTTSNPSKDMSTCSICLDNLADERGMLNCCAHVFCANCIKPWAKLQGTCPLDRKRILTIYVSSQADASFKETIVVETIQYEEFCINELTSGLSDIPKEDRVKYLRKKLLVLRSIRWKIIHRLRSDNYFTLFVDSDDTVLSQEMILINLSARHQVVAEQLVHLRLLEETRNNSES